MFRDTKTVSNEKFVGRTAGIKNFKVYYCCEKMVKNSGSPLFRPARGETLGGLILVGVNTKLFGPNTMRNSSST